MSDWPCRADPDLWFSSDRGDMGRAIHACLRHCPRLDECRRTEPPQPECVLAGIRYGFDRRVRRHQPAEVSCVSCSGLRRAA